MNRSSNIFLFVLLVFFISCSSKSSSIKEEVKQEKKKELLLDNGAGFNNFLLEEIREEDFFYNKLSTDFFLKNVQSLTPNVLEESTVIEENVKLVKNVHEFKHEIKLFFSSCEVFIKKDNGYDCIDKQDLSFSLKANCKSFFLVNGDTFLLEDIFNPIGKAYSQHNFRIGDILSFEFNEDLYFIVNVLESCINETTNIVRSFLFYIGKNNVPRLILTPYFQGTQTICPFNDFNEDGNLDYAGWNWDKSKIEFFTLKKNQFIKDSTFYVKLNEEEYSDGYQGFTIDFDKTNWCNSLDSLKEVLY